MTIGIDLGNYRTSLISDQVAWSSLADREHHFLSWVTSENNVAIVGEAALSIVDMHGYEHVYSRFIDKIGQDDQQYMIANQHLTSFDLVSFLFKKSQILSQASQDNYILAVPDNTETPQKMTLVACAQRQGCKVKAVITQSLAKAIALIHRENFKLGTVFAIYDWEDSMFTFSIYRVISTYGLEILASQSLEHVSQFACDQRLWALIAEKYKAARGRDLTEQVLSQQHPDIKECKNNLEKYGIASIALRQNNFDITFTEFDERTQDLVKQSLNKIEQAFRQANLLESDLNGGVYILGTSSQSNIESNTVSIIDPVKKSFTCQVNVEEGLGLAAKGAALFGQFYLNYSPDYRLQYFEIYDYSVLYLDRAQHYYGVVTSVYDPQLQADKDQNYPLIAKGQTLPTQYQTTLHTDENGQTQIDFQFTTALINTQQLEHVQKMPIQQLEFAQGAQRLVELTLNITIDLDHNLICTVQNHFTGETREVKQADPIFGKYQQWRDPLIVVQ